MKIMTEEKMNEIVGGGINAWMLAGISALITFVVGVIDGFTRPLKCN